MDKSVRMLQSLLTNVTPHVIPPVQQRAPVQGRK